jgi:hypothetical protein
VLQVCGFAGMCFIWVMCVTGVGICSFAFNIGYVCYRCGNLHVCVQCRLLELQLWESGDLCLI